MVTQTFWQPWTLIKHFPGKEYYDRFEFDIYAITALYHKIYIPLAPIGA